MLGLALYRAFPPSEVDSGLHREVTAFGERGSAGRQGLSDQTSRRPMAIEQHSMGARAILDRRGRVESVLRCSSRC